MMRRHLGYSPAEVDAMSWAEIRMWIEGLNMEFSDEEDEGSRADAVEDLGGLASFGVAVRQVG